MFWDVGAYTQLGVSILEVAVHPSYSNFFLETWQKRLVWVSVCLGLLLVA